MKARQRIPFTALHGQLAWTRFGQVWAGWRITRPRPYGARRDADKHAVKDVHRMLWRSLGGECLAQGLVTNIDPATTVRRMFGGRAESHWHRVPDVVAEAEATMDTLADMVLGERTFWLWVPLRNDGSDWVREPGRSAARSLQDAVGLPVAGPSLETAAARAVQAQVIGRLIPPVLGPRPVTVAEQVWAWSHACSRGLWSTPADLEQPPGAPRMHAGVAVTEPVVDEGGRTDATTRLHNPLTRRFVKITDPNAADSDQPPSYQSLLAITDFPAGGMVFPGSEYLGRIDESGVLADFAVRIRSNSRDKTLRATQKAVRHLNDQYNQRAAAATTGHHELDLAGELLGAYQAVFANDPNETEIQHATLLAVGATTAHTAQEGAKDLARYLQQAGIKVDRPVGGQASLWWGANHGVPTSRHVITYYQRTTASDFARAVPFVSSRVGDPDGPLLAWNISVPTMLAPVHLNPAAYPAAGGSASLGVTGELGSGKALALDTPIPTPTGWARMGDLAVGDMVLDESGRPTPVVYVSPVMTGHRCYEVEFSDGASIVADAEHLWTTLPRRTRTAHHKSNWKRRASGDGTQVDLGRRVEELTGAGWWQHGTPVTTEGLCTTLRNGGQADHAIPLTAPLQLPEQTLPVDPYFLGCWLGDGTTIRPELTTADPEIVGYIEAAGYTVRPDRSDALRYVIGLPAEPRSQPLRRPCQHCGCVIVVRYPHQRYCGLECSAAARRAGAVPAARARCASCDRELGPTSTGRRCAGCWHAASLRGRLAELGVLGRKHIPPAYLRSSEPQRRALLAGLLDTDGTVAPAGTVEFDTTTEQLGRDVHELACSLGYRATIREGRARLYGRDCGPRWRVSFTTTDQVFQLTRKRVLHAGRTRGARPSRHRVRHVIAVREMATVPVRCIQVAAPSQLYLAGRHMVPTHNTYFLKAMSGYVVDDGGQVLAIDRTAEGEWAHFAASVSAHQVVECTSPQLSMDPLRVFGPQEGAGILLGFLSPLMDVRLNSAEGIVLSTVLTPTYLAEQQLHSCGAVMEHLAAGGCQLEGAVRVGTHMRTHAARPFARVIFDPDLPPARLDAPFTVLRTNSLELPSREEMASDRRMDVMGPAKLFGRAYYALLTATIRKVAFADRSQFTFFPTDEVHGLCISPEAEREVTLFVREGRRANAAAGLGDQDLVGTVGSSTLLELLTTRVVMRSSRTLAQRALVWAGHDPGDPSFEAAVERIATDTSPKDPGTNTVPVHRRGEGLLRDSRGDVAWIKVRPPANPARARALESGPIPARQEQA